ncbi:hypothetical protein Tco_0927282 [Tanacetum coccineum]
MDFHLHINDQISLDYFQAFHCDAIRGQMLYQFQRNQRDYFSNDTFRGRSLVSCAVEAAKFVRDFKPLANEADESLAKHKALEFEIEHLLRAVVSQDIMSIVQNPTVVKTSDLQTGLEHTLDPLSQKLENENVELEFQVLNYAKENAHHKTSYKNLFDSINVTRTQTKIIIDSLQEKLHNTIYENAKLRA